MSTRRTDKSTSQIPSPVFSEVSKDILSDKGSSFNILKDKDFEKSRKVPVAAKRKSLIHEHGKGGKLQAAMALEDEEENALFEIGEFGDANPVSLQRTVWWLLSLHFGFRTRDESRKQITYMTFTAKYQESAHSREEKSHKK